MKKCILLFICLLFITCTGCKKDKNKDDKPVIDYNQEFDVNFYVDGELYSFTTVKYGETAVLEDEEPSKESTHDYKYEFVGWDKSLENITSDLDVNAVFNEIYRYYTVKFYDYDGTLYKTIENVYEGTQAKITDNPTRFGYDFDKWQGDYKKVFKDCDCYAKYKPIEYSISFDCFGNIGEMPESIPYTIEDDFELPIPETKYKYVGWSWDMYWEEETITKLPLGTTGDITLYLHVDMDESKTEAIYLNYDNSIYTVNNMTDIPEDNERLGYTFKGWTNIKDNSADSVIRPIYEINTYSVSYDLGIDSAKPSNELKNNYTIEDDYNLPYLTLNGYCFLGWYQNKDFTGNSISHLETGDYNLYARLVEEKSYGEYYVVTSDEVVQLGLSTQAYLKHNDEYISPSLVNFNSNNSCEIGKDGFVICNELGYACIEITYNDVVVSKIIEIVRDKKYEYVGHTGCIENGTVQNTYDAFVAGAKRGYAALECDVRLSKDNVLFIHHDNVFYVDRSKACAPFKEDVLVKYGVPVEAQLSSYTWDVLKNLEVCNGAFSSKLCLLEDYLKVCKEYNIKAVIEIKWNPGMVPSDQSNVHLLVDLVKKMGMYEHTIFMTSMQEVLLHIRTNNPDAALQYLSSTTTTTESYLDWCIRHKISLDCPWEYVNRLYVAKMHEAHLYVNIYTAETKAQESNGIKFGADMITTDYLY